MDDITLRELLPIFVSLNDLKKERVNIMAVEQMVELVGTDEVESEYLDILNSRRISPSSLLSSQYMYSPTSQYYKVVDTDLVPLIKDSSSYDTKLGLSYQYLGQSVMLVYLIYNYLIHTIYQLDDFKIVYEHMDDDLKETIDAIGKLETIRRLTLEKSNYDLSPITLLTKLAQIELCLIGVETISAESRKFLRYQNRYLELLSLNKCAVDYSTINTITSFESLQNLEIMNTLKGTISASSLERLLQSAPVRYLNLSGTVITNISSLLMYLVTNDKLEKFIYNLVEEKEDKNHYPSLRSLITKNETIRTLGIPVVDGRGGEIGIIHSLLSNKTVSRLEVFNIIDLVLWREQFVSKIETLLEFKYTTSTLHSLPINRGMMKLISSKMK